MIQARATALFLALAAFSLPLAAQHLSYISGQIVDPSSSSVPDAVISALNEDTGFRRNAVSQADGRYLIPALQSGLYKLTVRRLGFRTMIRFGVRVGESEPARVDFTLVIGNVLETVTVEGSKVAPIPAEASVGIDVSGDSLDRLPLNGTSLLGALELTPGVVVTPATRGESGQFTVNGQRPNTHYFTVDGASANSGVSGGASPAQSTGGALPSLTAFGSLDSVSSIGELEELRVQTSSTSSEFGRMPGAQISVNSRAGSNEIHGGLLFDFRNEALNANDWLANQQGLPRTAARFDDLTPELGGPLLRDRTFFFLSYENERLMQPFTMVEALPSPALSASAPSWLTPLLNFLPSPNGPDLGSGVAAWRSDFSRPSHLDAGSFRIDQAINSRLTAFARYSESASSTEFGSGTVSWLDLRSRSLTASLNLRVKPNLDLDLRVNTSGAAARSQWLPEDGSALPTCYLQSVIAAVAGSGAGCDYLVRLSVTGVAPIVSGSEGHRSQSQFETTGTATWNQSRHAVNAGIDYRTLHPVRDDASGSVAILANTFPDLIGGTNFWKAYAPAQHLQARVSEISLYAQDTWRVTSHLTATYGLRWEIGLAPNSSGTANYVDPATGNTIAGQHPIWKSSFDNFAPRLGLAYAFGKDGRTVLRAGAGLYYDSSLSLATDLVNDGPLNESQFGSSRFQFSSSVLTYGFVPNLRLPEVIQWNVSLEHALTSRDVVSATYLGSIGRYLIRREAGITGSADTSLVVLATNDGASNFESTQLQYRRRLSRGFEGLASYSLSHSIDNSSSDSGLYWVGSGLNPGLDRADSDFDIRHTFSAGLTYQLPAPFSRQRFLKGWALDGVAHARSGFPLTILDSEQFSGISFENALRPNLVGGVPVWIYDSQAPGGRILNPGAFSVVSGEGNLGRNALRGFGMWQLDLGLRKEFFSAERCHLEFRAEAFNLLNKPNFADPVAYLTSPLFGQSTSMLSYMLGSGSPASGLAPMFQSGGPRSMQLTLQFRF